MDNQPTDAEMLDWLEAQNAKAEYTGRCMFRWSETGRGWRLHEAPAGGAFASVREAIADAMLRARAPRETVGEGK